MSKKTLALSHINNYINGGKNTILLLENKFFYIFKIQIENVLNEEDRKEKLEDRLEIVFPRYNSDDFILRYEIYKKEKKRENIVVYLMDINYLNDCIIDDMKDYGFISIIPSFFISREKKDLNHYFNFDISETMLVITEYMNNNILDIQSFKLTKSSLDSEDFEIEDKFSIINTFLANITEDIHIVFTGDKINFEDLELENKTYSFYSVDNLDFLNEIMKVEIRYIEKNINDGNIKNAVDYIVLNEAGEKIFLIADPSKRISLGGYTLLNDEIKINAFNFVNIHFKKKVSIKDKNYFIFATVKYEVGSSRDLESLYNGVLTRMWIKEDV